MRSQTDARSILEPLAAPLRLFSRHFEPFPAPDAIDALDVYPPPLGNEHLANAAIAVETTPRRQPHDRVRQRRIVIGLLQLPSLLRTLLSGDSACSTLRVGKARADVRDARRLRRDGLRAFPQWLLFRISLSSVSSETAFLSRSILAFETIKPFGLTELQAALFTPPPVSA